MHFSDTLGFVSVLVLGGSVPLPFIAYFLARTELRSLGGCSRVFLWRYIAFIFAAWLVTLAACYIARQDTRPEVYRPGWILYEAAVLFWLCTGLRIVRTVRSQLFLTSRRVSWHTGNLTQLIDSLLWYSRGQILVLRVGAGGLEVVVDGRLIRNLPATAPEGNGALRELRNSRAFRFLQMRPPRAGHDPDMLPVSIRIFYDRGKPVMESTYA